MSDRPRSSSRFAPILRWILGAPPPPPARGPTGATPLDERMMGRALELARSGATAGEVPVGAVVYETSTGRVLGEAFNTRERDADPTAHAELLAVRQAAGALGDWRLNACTVVVTLEPCPMCAGLMVNARVGRVVYGTADPKAGACESLYSLASDARLNHRCVVLGGVRAEECADVLRRFFRERRAERRSLGEAPPHA
ncbi:MAG TPA: tRNA adenosine(34) deaminase TadA [Phycisphaerales bacterium]|nr:tRNA adenosine(34) deaminase TadA [Phycisphaerales bacterium]